MDFLLSLMYRLDIDEHKINLALSPKAIVPPNVGLAHLILERQKYKYLSFPFQCGGGPWTITRWCTPTSSPPSSIETLATIATTMLHQHWDRLG